MSFDFQEFQRQIIAEFRANEGRVGGMFEGAALALITTVGARSGVRRTSPLGYLEVGGQTVVVASANGAPSNPGWYHNIRKNPMVTVEFGTDSFAAIAAIPQGAERDRLFADIVELEPGFGEYQAKTTRVIPVVILHRIESEGLERVRGLGDFIVESHEWLRRELAELREQVRGLGDGGVVDGPRADLGQQMRTHCLEFCGALKQHHTGESMGAFPMLEQRFPGLEPVLSKLGEEHKVVARLLQDIEQLIQDYQPGTSDPEQLATELERLAAELEAHFEFEERSIVLALNALGPAPAHLG